LTHEQLRIVNAIRLLEKTNRERYNDKFVQVIGFKIHGITEKLDKYQEKKHIVNIGIMDDE
jgi:hypothetical protein